MFTITAPLDLLAAAACIAPTKDVRFYLNGVFFDAAASTLVATDGSMAFIGAPGEVAADGKAANVILPINFVQRVIKIAKARKVKHVEVTVDGDTVRAETEMAKAVDGRFPDWRRIYAEPNGEKANIRADLIAKAAKADRALGAKFGRFTIHQGGSGCSVAVLCNNRAHVIMMPFRASDEPFRRFAV